MNPTPEDENKQMENLEQVGLGPQQNLYSDFVHTITLNGESQVEQNYQEGVQINSHPQQQQVFFEGSKEGVQYNSYPQQQVFFEGSKEGVQYNSHPQQQQVFFEGGNQGFIQSGHQQIMHQMGPPMMNQMAPPMMQKLPPPVFFNQSMNMETQGQVIYPQQQMLPTGKGLSRSFVAAPMQPVRYEQVPVKNIVYEQVPVKTISYQQVPVQMQQAPIQVPIAYEKPEPVRMQPPPPPPQPVVIDNSPGYKAEIEKLTFILNEKNEEIESWRRKCGHLEQHLMERKEKVVKAAPQVQVVEKIVEVPKYVEKIVDKTNYDLENQFRVLLNENASLKASMDDRDRQEKVKQKPQDRVVERKVEIPIEVVKYVDKYIDRVVEKKVEVPIEVVKYVDKVREVPIEVVKYIDRPVEKIIEKKVEVPVMIDRPVEKIVEKRVEVPIEVVRTIEKKVEVPIEIIKYVDKIIEKPVRVPVEVIKYVDKIIEKKVEVPVEVMKEKVVVDERRIKELDMQLGGVMEENKKLKITLDDWRVKLMNFENNSLQVEQININFKNDNAFLKAELAKMKIEIENWRGKYQTLISQGPQIVEKIIDRPIEVIKIVDRPIEKIIEKKIEVPVEIVKYVDKIIEKPIEIVKEKVIVDEKRIKEVEGHLKTVIEENRKLQITLDDWRRKLLSLENEKSEWVKMKFEFESLQVKFNGLVKEGPKVIEKRVEVPVEVVKYIDKIVEKPVEVVKVDNRRIYDLESQINLLTEENRRLKTNIEEWRIEINTLRRQEPRVVEKVVERPVEIIKIDDRKVNELTMMIRDYEARIREYEVTISSLRMEVQNFKEDKHRVEGVKRDQTGTIERLVSEIKRLEGVVLELRSKQGNMVEYENKIAMLVSENERLRMEFERIRTNYSKLEITIREKGNFEYEVTRVKDLLVVREREVEEWRRKYVEINNVFTEYKSKVIEYENKIAMLSSEIERLQIILKDSRSKEGGLIEYENKIAMLSSEIERLHIVIRDYRSKDERLIEYENKIAMLSSEIERLQVMLKEYRGKEGGLIEYENKIAMLSSEIERLQRMQNGYRQDIESWKAKYGQLEISIQNQGSSNLDMQKILVELKTKETLIFDYEQKLAMWGPEIERLTLIIREKEQEIENLKMMYAPELQRLQVMLNDKNAEIDSLKGGR